MQAHNREGVTLLRLGGTPIVLSYTWFIIAVFTVFSFGPQIARSFPELGAGAYLLAFGYAVLLALSVLVHELAHALVARAFGSKVHKIVLNLWGGHTQFSATRLGPGKTLLIALAGPVANLILAALGYALLHGIEPLTPLHLLINIFALTNLLVAIFNVLPGLPLDGGRIVETLVWKLTGSQTKGTVAAGWCGRVIAVLILAWYVYQFTDSNDSPELSYLVIGLAVCAFLFMGASAAIKGARVRQRVGSLSIASLARPATGAPAAQTLAGLPAAVVHAEVCGVVQDPQGYPQALIDPAVLAAVPAQDWRHATVTSVSRPLQNPQVVPDTLSTQELLNRLSATNARDVIVTDQRGFITGFFTQHDVTQALKGKKNTR